MINLTSSSWPRQTSTGCGEPDLALRFEAARVTIARKVGSVTAIMPSISFEPG